MTKTQLNSRKLDVLFLNPDSSLQAYQGLAEIYAAIDPPTWALLLAVGSKFRQQNYGNS